MSNETSTTTPDRRRDVPGWLLTPLITLGLAPALTAAVGMLVLFGNDTAAPCEQLLMENRCEETTLSLLGSHGVLFGLLWLLLWAVPWWRGLRAPRIVLALVAGAVLIAAPLRMVGTLP